MAARVSAWQKTISMRLFLSRLHFPVTTLGPGRRVGIWLQGCSLRCPGCVSVDTWAGGRGETTVTAVLDTVVSWLEQADGVTISGGEPFEQPEALETLLRGLREHAPTGCDLLVYSGYPWEQLAPQVDAWPELVDVLISDPYRVGAGQTLLWRGSDNQRMHLLTPLGRVRYAQWQCAPRTALPHALDVVFFGNEVWMAGIPAPGTMEALQARLAAAGFVSGTSQAHSPSISA